MKITLVNLTCNRKDSIEALLQSIKKQYLQPDEIIVVDNNSKDGTFSYISKRFPGVIILQLEKNMGAAGRNEGIKRATGNIIVTLDDDVFFAESNGIERINQIFRQEEEIAVLNFKILDDETRKILPFNWFHPYKIEDHSDRNFITDYISEGAVAFRKEIFDKVGYYPEEFFISHEGPDLAYRILDAGYDIYYSSYISVVHKCSTVHRVKWRNTYYDTRNQIWLAVRNLPFFRAIFHIAYRLITTLLFSLKRKQLKWYIKAVIDGFMGIKKELQYRKPISRDTVRQLKKIRKNKPGVVYNILSFMKRAKSINEKFTR